MVNSAEGGRERELISSVCKQEKKSNQILTATTKRKKEGNRTVRLCCFFSYHQVLVHSETFRSRLLDGWLVTPVDGIKLNL